MQTALDCNGSNTITINNTNENDSYTTAMTQQQQQQQQHNQHHESQNQQSHSLTQQPPMAVQEIRKIEGIAQTQNNDLSHLIDAADYLCSDVEYVTVTAPLPPQALHSKTCCNSSNQFEVGGKGCVTEITLKSLQDAYKSNTSSENWSSKTATSSTSKTSSVIGISGLKRNGTSSSDRLLDDINADSDHGQDYDGDVDVDGKQIQQQKKIIRECNNKQLLLNQMLPNDNTSSRTATTTKPELSSFSLLKPTSSSSITSLSITTSTVAISPITPTPTPTPSSSDSSTSDMSSSSASTTTSTTPASATTTPALLSTPTSLSSSPCSSFSSSAASSSASSVASSSSNRTKMKGLSISGLVEAELLQWQDMPQYLQFNPYVINGYRPLQTFKGCLLSLFYWHNETINILTHAIPIVYILAIIPGLMPWDRGYSFLSFCHVFGSVAPWCGSFVYHLFMNIEKGENVYYRLLKLDMVGIWVSQSFGALPLVTATTFCFTFKWKWFIIISYCLLALWGLYKALTASSPWQRRLCFALPFTMRTILTFFRTIGLVGGNRVALEHVYLQDAVSIFGGAIGAMRIPEKWFPGLVDFYLNSHNIMHVLVVVAVYSMHKATIKDFEWMDSANCDDFTNATDKVLETTLNTKIELWPFDLSTLLNYYNRFLFLISFNS